MIKRSTTFFAIILFFLLGLMTGDMLFGDGKWITRISFLIIGMTIGKLLIENNSKDKSGHALNAQDLTGGKEG
jgi:hypothetical protein